MKIFAKYGNYLFQKLEKKKWSMGKISSTRGEKSKFYLHLQITSLSIDLLNMKNK